MFMIGPQLGSYTRLVQKELDQLHNTYTSIQEKERQSLDTGRKEIQHYVDELIKAAEQAAKAQEQSASKDDAGGKAMKNENFQTMIRKPEGLKKSNRSSDY